MRDWGKSCVRSRHGLVLGDPGRMRRTVPRLWTSQENWSRLSTGCQLEVWDLSTAAQDPEVEIHLCFPEIWTIQKKGSHEESVLWQLSTVAHSVFRDTVYTFLFILTLFFSLLIPSLCCRASFSPSLHLHFLELNFSTALRSWHSILCSKWEEPGIKLWKRDEQP